MTTDLPSSMQLGALGTAEKGSIVCRTFSSLRSTSSSDEGCVVCNVMSEYSQKSQNWVVDIGLSQIKGDDDKSRVACGDLQDQ